MRPRTAFVALAAALFASSADAQDDKPPAKAPFVVDDPQAVDRLLDLVAKKDDAVREKTFAALLRTKDASALDEIRVHGLAHADGIVRGYAARACGRLHVDAAKPALEAMLDDAHWFARAEAAVALAELKDEQAIAAMRRIVNTDPSEKALTAAMDALAMFHEDADSALLIVAKKLDHRAWQTRVAAAQALGGFDSTAAVGPLINRMEIETGHVSNEIYAALKSISRDDLGRKPEAWRKWWEEKGGNASARGVFGGLEIFTNRVAFLVDTSESMRERFAPADPGAEARGLVDRSKLDLCKDQITHAVSALDPRSHFNVLAFGAETRAFQTKLVHPTTDAAPLAEWLRALTAKGTADTASYFAGLRAAVCLGDDPDDGPNFRDTADTITLITDGVRADSPLLDTATLVEWFTSMNRYARVTTNVVCLGSRGGDVEWLRRLAERNGGKFTLVKEKGQ